MKDSKKWTKLLIFLIVVSSATTILPSCKNSASTEEKDVIELTGNPLTELEIERRKNELSETEKKEKNRISEESAEEIQQIESSSLTKGEKKTEIEKVEGEKKKAEDKIEAFEAEEDSSD